MTILVARDTLLPALALVAVWMPLPISTLIRAFTGIVAKLMTARCQRPSRAGR